MLLYAKGFYNHSNLCEKGDIVSHSRLAELFMCPEILHFDTISTSIRLHEPRLQLAMTASVQSLTEIIIRK